MKKKKILFVSLAANQAHFFAKIGNLLKMQGLEVAHACFHEESQRWLEKNSGMRSFNPYSLVQNEWSTIKFEDFGIDRAAVLLGHEKAAYEIRDTSRLTIKFKQHLSAMEWILSSFSEDGSPVMVIQELGGFTSVLAAYYAARKLNFENIFIEPSFFKGRIFLTRNSLLAPVVTDQHADLPSEEVKQRLAQILKTQTVAIPVKDRHHYRGAWHKLKDPKNVKRLAQKLIAKHVHGEREEFEHISGHVLRHLRMQLNTLKLQSKYQTELEERFIYYPLHVPADFALTIRSPEFLDQFALIDFLCRIAPLGYRVAIKEHPALVGAASPARVHDLHRRHDNLVLLHPSLNNHSVIHKASAVVTVNSKAGTEALLHKVPVLVLGDAFYRSTSLVTRINCLQELEPALRAAIQQSRRALDDEKVESYFQGVWNQSLPGELYDLTDENIRIFSNSLLSRVDA